MPGCSEFAAFSCTRLVTLLLHLVHPPAFAFALAFTFAFPFAFTLHGYPRIHGDWENHCLEVMPTAADFMDVVLLCKAGGAKITIWTIEALEARTDNGAHVATIACYAVMNE